jgi:hypothetical protein
MGTSPTATPSNTALEGGVLRAGFGSLGQRVCERDTGAGQRAPGALWKDHLVSVAPRLFCFNAGTRRAGLALIVDRMT